MEIRHDQEKTYATAQGRRHVPQAQEEIGRPMTQKKLLMAGGMLVAFVMYTRYRQAVADGAIANAQAASRMGYSTW
jgi:hypothetical protein